MKSRGVSTGQVAAIMALAGLIIISTVGVIFSHKKKAPEASGAIYPKLELIDVLQLSEDYDRRFDFSGIVLDGFSILGVSDKDHDNSIYEVSIKEPHFFVRPKYNFRTTTPLDIEGVDICDGAIYFISEKLNEVFKLEKLKDEPESVRIGFEKAGMNRLDWKDNAGLEGLAIDCEKKVIYLAKERDPRILFSASLKSGDILETFQIPETDSNDFADLKFYKGFLYVLERNASLITKVDVKTKSVVSKYSYAHVTKGPGGPLYGPTPYGLEEGLLVLDDEVWLAVDNNELEATKYAKETFRLKGTKPALMRFRKPSGF